MQWAGDLALSLQKSMSLLCLGFNAWPGNFFMLWVWPKNVKNAADVGIFYKRLVKNYSIGMTKQSQTIRRVHTYENSVNNG